MEINTNVNLIVNSYSEIYKQNIIELLDSIENNKIICKFSRTRSKQQKHIKYVFVTMSIGDLDTHYKQLIE